MQRDYVPRMINLERSDYQIVKRMAEERGLGDKGFSAAIRGFRSLPSLARWCGPGSLVRAGSGPVWGLGWRWVSGG